MSRKTLSWKIAIRPSKLVTVERERKEKSEAIANKDELASSITKWVSERADRGSRALNDGQQEARNLALRNTFQLIQGPPGETDIANYIHFASGANASH